MDSLRSPNRQPTHPGEILREDVLPELKLTIAEFAKRLHVSRSTVTEVLHERRAVTPDMAIRLAHFLGTSANSWLSMQQAVDIWKLEHQHAADYEMIQRVECEV